MSAAHPDLAIIVANSQEKMGTLVAKVESMHKRQDDMEKDLKETLKALVIEMKTVNEYINKQKGRDATIKVIGGILLTAIGSLIGKFLFK